MSGPDRGPLLYAYRPIPANPMTVAVLLLGLVVTFVIGPIAAGPEGLWPLGGLCFVPLAVRVVRGHARPHRDRARDERGPPPSDPLHPGIDPRVPRGDARLPRGDVGHPRSVRAQRRADGADSDKVLRRPGPRDAGSGARTARPHYRRVPRVLPPALHRGRNLDRALRGAG